MAAVTTATAVKVSLTAAKFAKKHWKKIVLVFGIMMLLMVSSFILLLNRGGSSGIANVSADVMQWKPVVSEYADKYGIPEYVDVILAIIQVESGGTGTSDVMQSSESLGLPPNSIEDPIFSIDTGVSHFASVIQDARRRGLDYWTPVQSYNFGSGFNNYVEKNGKTYSFELATAFSKDHANGKKVGYSASVADFNGNWRYQYGNMYYVDLIKQFLSSPDAAGLGGAEGREIGDASTSALGMQDYKTVMDEVLKYNGRAYVWGGSTPGQGFDCSGLMQWSYNLIGYKLPRTAAEQEKATVKISEPKPGDLIFFKGTNPDRPANSITHVGIYVDEKQMYNAASSGVGYATWSSGYWKKHFAGFGRVTK
jgi:cell wall-associated NlpC family hydrolase